MRNELIQYVQLLFAGLPDSEDMKQEILQNTLDRYDDLIGQGKSPEAAYRLAISGIGDVNELLSTIPNNKQTSDTLTHADPVTQDEDTPRKRMLRTVAIALYILCIIPLILLSEIGLDTLGLCATLSIVAVATVAILLGRKNDPDEEHIPSNVRYVKNTSPLHSLKKSLANLIWAVGVAVYFILSFITNAWYITWVLFPIIGCVEGLVNACLDLKEAVEHEN